MTRPLTILLLAVLLLVPAPLLAAGQTRDGKALAERLCARCHAIGPDGVSPVAEAPPFAGFAAKWPIEHLAEALAEGIVTGHGEIRMPEFTLEPEQIDDLIAYLRSLTR